LNRAALSATTDLTAGNGRLTNADRRNFFTIVQASAQECAPLLEPARRRKLLDEARHASMRDDLETITKMPGGLISGLQKLTHG